jgi:hypothetical protein
MGLFHPLQAWGSCGAHCCVLIRLGITELVQRFDRCLPSSGVASSSSQCLLDSYILHRPKVNVADLSISFSGVHRTGSAESLQNIGLRYIASA